MKRYRSDCCIPRLRACLWMLGCLLSAAPAAHAQAPVTLPPDGGSAEVVVYSDGTALVTDRRKVQIPKGRSLLRLAGLGGSPRLETLQVRFEPNPQAVRVVSTRLASGVSPALALAQALVGKEVTWIPTPPEGKPEERVKATLLELSSSGKPALLRVGDEILVSPAGRLVFPAVAELPPSTPFLEIGVDADEAGERSVEVAYLVEGWSWQARSLLTVDQKAATAEFSRAIRVGFPSGTLLPPARVRASEGAPTDEGAPLYEVPLSLAFTGPAASSTADWITLGRVARGLPLQELLLYTVPFTVPEPAARRGTGIQGVIEAVRFGNTAANGLGEPIPHGDVVIFRRSGDTLRYSGSAAWPAVPASSTVQLPVQPAVGLTATARVTGVRQLNPVTVEHACEVVVRSTRAEPADVVVTVDLSGNWKIDDATHEFRKVEKDRVEFPVRVPAGDVVRLTYNVEIKSE